MRVGFIGVGSHATRNLYPNLAPAGLELTATCARHQDRADAAAKRWGAAHAFDDVGRMLTSVQLDGVVICVQPWDYAPLIEQCLGAGVPVFCDKPAAATAGQATELADLSERTGVPVVVGYMKRFAPAYRRAREILRSPDFGDASLGTFTFAMGQGFGGDLRTYLIDNPVHPLDLARFLLGEITDLEAHVISRPEVGHAIAAMGRTTSGAVCTFNLCTTGSWEHRNEYVEIYGEGHAMWVENVDTCTYRPPQPPAQVWQPNYTVPRPANSSAVTTGFGPELEHFRHVVINGTTNESDMASAAATLALAERLCAVAGV